MGTNCSNDVQNWISTRLNRLSIAREYEYKYEYEYDFLPNGRDAATSHKAPNPLEGEMFLDPEVLFEKKLNFFDACGGWNRLIIPKSGTKNLMSFLTEEEEEKIEFLTDFLSVLTTDRDGAEYTLHMKLLSPSNAALKHQWINLVAVNRLKVGDWVQGLGYRVQPHEFRLQIIKK